MSDTAKMNLAQDLAEEALARGEMPIAACLFLEDRVIAQAYTSEKADGRLLVHAEQKTLLLADIQGYSLAERKKMQLFTTLEPCLMCYGAGLSFYLGEIVYSLRAPEDGALNLIKWENFRSGYLRNQQVAIRGGCGVERSRALFESYRQTEKSPTLAGFAGQVLAHNPAIPPPLAN